MGGPHLGYGGWTVDCTGGGGENPNVGRKGRLAEVKKRGRTGRGKKGGTRRLFEKALVKVILGGGKGFTVMTDATEKRGAIGSGTHGLGKV